MAKERIISSSQVTNGEETLTVRDFVLKYANDRQRASWSENNWQYRNWRHWFAEVNESRAVQGLSVFRPVVTN